MIIWLASYPKSGNTFLRSLLASYLYSRDGEFDFQLLENIQQFPINDNFEKIGVDVKNKYLVAENYIRAQEEINKKKKLTFLKTHSSFCKMYNKFNFSNLKNSLGVIYIVRDPRNVVTSFSNHNTKPISDTVELLCNDLATSNEKNEVEVYLGSWNFNYNSWKVYKSSKKYLLVKYEDLVRDTKNAFIEIIKFLNKLLNNQSKIDIKKIEKIIEETNFLRMQEMEKKYGFKEAKINDHTGEKVKFFHLGPKNNWKKNLDKHSISKIEKKFGNEMKELGYI